MAEAILVWVGFLVVVVLMVVVGLWLGRKLAKHQDEQRIMRGYYQEKRMEQAAQRLRDKGKI